MKRISIILIFFCFYQTIYANNEKIRAVFPENFKPYSYLNEKGQPAGFAIDVMNEIAKEKNLNIQYISKANWKEVWEDIYAGNADIYPSFGITKEREKYLDFSTPYTEFENGIFYQNIDKEVKELKDLCGQTVRLNETLAIRKDLEDMGCFKLEFNSIDTSLIQYLSGSINILAMPKSRGDDFARLAKTDAFKNYITVKKFSRGIGVKKNSPELLKIINESLQELEQKGKLDELREKWFEEYKHNSLNLTKVEKQWLAQNNEVRVRIGNFAPWEIATSKPSGMSVDYLENISDMTGITFKYIIGNDNWIDGFNDMATEHKKYDLIPNAKQTPQRLKKLSMSDEYLSSPYVVFVHEKSTLNNFDELKNKTIAIPKGFAIGKMIEENYPSIKINYTNNTKEAILEVVNNKAFAYIGNLIISQNLIYQEGLTNLKVVSSTPFGNHAQSMATRKEWSPLISIINKALKEIPEDVKIAIYNKWTGNAEFKNLDLSKEEKQYIKNKKILKVHSEQSWIPFSFIDNNKKPNDYMYDLKKLIEKRTGLKLEIQISSYDKAIEDTLSNKIDLMVDMPKLDENSDKLFYSKNSTYYYTEGIISQYGYKSFIELSGKRVGYIAGLDQYLAQYPDIQFVAYKDDKSLVLDVANGKLDAAIDCYVTLNYLVHELSLSNMSINLIDNNEDLFYHIATSKDNPILFSILEKVITKQDINDLKEKWGIAKKTTAKMINLSFQEKQLLENTTFNIHTNEWRPFRIYDASAKEFKGLAFDYFKEITQQLPLKYKIIHYDTFSDRLTASKTDDKAMSLFTTNLNNKSVSEFTIPYASYPVALVTSLNKNFIIDFNNLNGKDIAVGKNFSAYKFLNEHYPKINFIFTKTTKEALDLVARDKVYGAVDLYPVIKYELNHYGNVQLKISGTTKERLDVVITINKKYKNLIPVLNKAIENIPKENRELIENKWFNQEIIQQTSYQWLLYIVALLLGIIFILQIRKKKELEFKVKEQTQELLDANNKLNQKRKEIEEKNFKLEETNNELKEATQKLSEQEAELRVMNENLNQEVEKITDENFRQMQIIQEQSKTAALGEMISAIAHNWRQPLNEVNIRVQQLKFFYDRDPSLIDSNYITKFVEQNKETISFMSKTIDDFRNFFKTNKEKSEFEIYECVDKVLNILNAQIKNHEIKVDVTGDGFKIFGVSGELEQVILNIINNAQDQLIEKKVYEPKIDIDINDNIMTIEDNAGGVEPTIMKKIFDPYFTTKEEGKGTGIGLYMTKMIIEKSFGGSIKVINTKNGAKFIINFN